MTNDPATRDEPVADAAAAFGAALDRLCDAYVAATDATVKRLKAEIMNPGNRPGNAAS